MRFLFFVFGFILTVSMLPIVFSHPSAFSFHSLVHLHRKHSIPAAAPRRPDHQPVSAETPTHKKLNFHTTDNGFWSRDIIPLQLSNPIEKPIHARIFLQIQ